MFEDCYTIRSIFFVGISDCKHLLMSASYNGTKVFLYRMAS